MNWRFVILEIDEHLDVKMVGKSSHDPREPERRAKMQEHETMLFDLNRCEHGRHEGDDCFSCGGPSKGNPVVDLNDRIIGYSLSGEPIRIPRRGESWT